jgi:8-oxo-dGTP pyrophosphatase MutT (NUDIX family)
MTDRLDIERVRRAVADATPTPLEELLLLRDLQGRLLRSMQPPQGVTPREAAALLLLVPTGNDMLLPLTLRSATLPTHSGEVSLPGGGADPGDASPTATALRETHEELGIDPQAVEVWGTLTPIYIPPSNFRLTPVVGFTPALPALAPNPGEVDAVLLVRLSRLLDPATVVIEEWERRGMPMRVPFFALEGHKVWGATALVLSELVARLRRHAD